MAIDERARHALYRKLEETIGAEEATTLMEHLPPVGWADVVTKSDLAAVRDELRGEIGGLRGEIGELRGEIGGLRGEIGGLRGEMLGMEGRLRLEMAKNMRTIVLANLGTAATIAALAFAAVRLG